MTFKFTFTVRAPIESVAAFHRDTQALRKLVAPPVIVKPHTLEPMGEGSISDFTLWFGPIPVHWVAQHSRVDELRGFTDTQVRGPMKRWIHSHKFSAVSTDLTRIEENIEYEHFQGLRGVFSRILFSSIGLRITFLYRKTVTCRLLEPKSLGSQDI